MRFKDQANLFDTPLITPKEMTKFTAILATGMLVAGFVPSVFGNIFCDDGWVAVGATFSEWDVSSSFRPAYTGLSLHLGH